MHCRRVTLFLIVAVMPIILSACGAAHHSIFRNRTVRSDGPSIIAVDAKQRTILAVPHPRDGATREQQMRMCAEASPDVFSVIAQSLSATGSFEQTPDPASVRAAASIAASTSEQGSTIPRTQTINMLRELMYRTCERYLNGAISSLEMPIQAVRDQRLMVAILAIEQLTGAVTPPTVVIGASAGGSAGASPADAIVRLDNARKRLETAEADLVAKRNDYNALNAAANPPTCDSITAKVAANTPLTDTEPAKQTECNNAKAALTAAEAEREAAASAYQTLQRAMNVGGGGPVTTTTTVQQGDHGSGEIARAHSGSIKDVAETVRFIVAQNYEQDEYLLFCIRVLGQTTAEGRSVAESAPGVITDCSTYVRENLRREAAEAALRATRAYAAARIQSVTADDQLFEVFWTKVAPGSVLDRTKLANIVDAYINTYVTTFGWASPDLSLLIRLKSATDRDAARAIFGDLADDVRAALARQEN